MRPDRRIGPRVMAVVCAVLAVCAVAPAQSLDTSVDPGGTPTAVEPDTGALIRAIRARGAEHGVAVAATAQAKLIADDGAADDYFGYAVAVSGDTAVVGARGATVAGQSARGAAYVFVRSAGVWTQQAKLTASDGAAGDSFGISVALDGDTAVVGANGATVAGNLLQGAAYVFVRSAGVWTQQAKLTASDGAADDSPQFGSAVAVSGDTAVVGASRAGTGARGAAYVFDRSGTVWTQSARLAASDGGGVHGGFGRAVALDAQTVAVGISDNAAYVFVRQAGAWTQQAKLTASDAGANDNFGFSVAVSADTVVVGALSANSYRGAAYAFVRSGTTWTQQAKLTGSDIGPNDEFGSAVALRGDTVVVGAHQAGFLFVPGPGAAFVFGRSAGVWSQQGKLTASDSKDLGISVALSGDTVLAGADFTIINGKSFQGAAYPFLLSSTVCPAITVSPANLPAGVVGTAYRQTITPSGGVGTTRMTVSSGTLPTGLGLSFDGDLAGTPTAPGTFTFTASATDTNGCAGSRTYTLTVGGTLPTMALDKTALVFGAVAGGTAFAAQTPAQTVRLRQTGAGTVTWTAASTTPWLVVSPATGTGSATLTVGVQFLAGLAATETGSITLTLTGAGSTAGPIAVTLTVVSSTAAVSAPFGVIDTPVGDATVLAGSIAMTGWALDNIGVQRVELWRDLQAGETTTPFASTPSDPRHGKVFISNATLVEGARPDVEALYPTTPVASRAGWGYLLLTWGLWNQGNGTYRLYAYAFDQENNLGTLGTKTVVVSNTAATKPFGSIDTPAIGGEASGPNFGWGLTPKVNGVATCKIQPSGVQVSIDSGPLQPVVYGADVRADIAGAFTGFSNSAAAGGHFIVDWTTLTTGAHTIGWLITDDCNRADGVGSRFFNVTGGTSALTAPAFRLKAEATPPSLVASASRRKDDPVLVARGYGELPAIVDPGPDGSRIVEVKQGERIEIRVPRGFESADQLGVNGERRDLPVGSTWDAASGTFYWQPAAGFLGRYRIVFTNGTERISVRVIVVP